MSLQRRHPDAGYANLGKMPKGPNGRALCRECHVEVPAGRYTFCSEACVRAWKLKSDPASQRHAVLQRDHGICASCGRDCLAVEERVRAVLTYGPDFFRCEPTPARAFMRAVRLRGWLRRFGLMGSASIPTFWQADHILPVCQGGGPERGQTCAEVLANLRTLCTPCHKAETRELARRRAAARKDSRS